MVNKDELSIKIDKIEENFINMMEDLRDSLKIEEKNEILLLDKLNKMKDESKKEFIEVMNETNPIESPEEIYFKNEAKKILGIELKKIKLKESFKLNDLSKLIKNLGLGIFNKQKFNKLVRECIVPTPQKKEKNQFLYDKRHIPYAILIQCFQSLDVLEYLKLLSLVDEKNSSEDIYISYKNYIYQDQDMYYCTMNNINNFAINTYLAFFSYKNTTGKDMKNEYLGMINLMNEQMNKLLEPLENNKDLSEEKIDFYTRDIKANIFPIKIMVFQSIIDEFLEIRKSIINEIDEFNNQNNN